MNLSALLTDLDAVVVTSPANLFFVSGIPNEDAVVLITKDANYYVTSPLYEVEVRHSLPRFLTPLVARDRSIVSVVGESIGRYRNIGIECADMDVSTYRMLFSEPTCHVIDIADRFAAQRLVKTREELLHIKHAEHIVDIAFENVIKALHEGMTEKQVRYLLQDRMLREGADGTAFDTIIAFGENAAKPHAVPSDRALRKGDCVVMDFGAKYRGYCSDFTRTVYCGTPSERFRKAYSCVLKAHNDAITYFANGGRSASEADAIARKVINDSEFAGLFTHSLGHGVGIEIHECPSLRPKSTDVLYDNTVFTIEPGIYVEGEFGIRIESLVALENGKLTVIDRSNKEIITV